MAFLLNGWKYFSVLAENIIVSAFKNTAGSEARRLRRVTARLIGKRIRAAVVTEPAYRVIYKFPFAGE